MPYSPVSRTRKTQTGRTLVYAGYTTAENGPFPSCLLQKASVNAVAQWKWTDEVTYGPDFPEYANRIAMGKTTTTGLIGTKRLLHWSPITYRHSGKGLLVSKCKTLIYSGPPSGMSFGGDPGGSESAAAEKIAASNFLKSYLKEIVAFRGANAIAEFSDTLRMFVSPCKQLYKHTWNYVGRLGKLKKVYRRDPVEYSRLLANSWLAYSFGVKPLVSDIAELNLALRNLGGNLGSVDTMRIIGTGTASSGYRVSHNSGCGHSSAFLYQDVTEETHLSVRYLGAIAARPPGVGLLTESFGVGLTDIVPAVWEAIPFSFMIDYFTNVSEMLDSLKLATANMAWLNRTTRNSTIRKGSQPSPVANPASLNYDISSYGGQWKSSITRVNRVDRTGQVVYPSWEFKIPGWKSSKWINLAALGRAIQKTNPRYRQVNGQDVD